VLVYDAPCVIRSNKIAQGRRPRLSITALQLSSAGENIGIGFELQVITIVLLGGVSIFGGTGTILGVALAAFVYAGLRSALLLTSSFNESDFQVVSGGLLILSVLIPNAASFAQRLRAFARRRRA
jgi:rhamnose transport system permease protein